jgi:hypothetical protein
MDDAMRADLEPYIVVKKTPHPELMINQLRKHVDGVLTVGFIKCYFNHNLKKQAVKEIINNYKNHP